jgi:glycosyltransferase involved in cell wall biosynthesis
MSTRKLHIAFFMASLGGGGIGKMRIHLSRELHQLGVKVDLVLGKTGGPYFDRIDASMGCIRTGSSHKLLSPMVLGYYLMRRKPDILVTERIRVNVVAHRARRLVRAKTLLLAGVHTTMSLEIENLHPHKRASHLSLMRRYYPQNDGFIGISEGVAEDLVSLIDIPRDKVHIAYNPVITPELYRLAKEKPDHPWLGGDAVPVVLASGRLEPQKDFDTLLRAFAILRRSRAARLIILGRGSRQQQLKDLIAELGLSADVALPGFVANPYSYMANANLFVLSSAWEGFGNVLAEALALGLPAVATDCPSGPREILQHGKVGSLVAVGDVDGLAAAMARTLEGPPAPSMLTSAAAPFTAESSARQYIRIFENVMTRRERS